MRPDSLLRLWRYINPLLTYLLTCLTVAKFCTKDAKFQRKIWTTASLKIVISSYFGKI